MRRKGVLKVLHEFNKLVFSLLWFAESDRLFSYVESWAEGLFLF